MVRATCEVNLLRRQRLRFLAPSIFSYAAPFSRSTYPVPPLADRPDGQACVPTLTGDPQSTAPRPQTRWARSCTCAPFPVSRLQPVRTPPVPASAERPPPASSQLAPPVAKPTQ